MASPCKKIRLSPLSKTSSLSPRLTQDSKITSTPKRSSGNIASPSVSTISSSSHKTVRTRLSDVFETSEYGHNYQSSSSGSEDNEQTSDTIERSFTTSSRESETSKALIEDYDAFFDDSIRIKYKGIIWELYKPISENNLYGNILVNPCHVQDVVNELFLLYKQKPQNAVLNIIKFCVDVAGFQTFDVSLYNFKDDAPKLLIESLEVSDKPNILETTGRYLLMEDKTELAKILKMAVYNFINKLISTAYKKGVLHDDIFSKNIFSLLKCMSFSKMIAIRHTGVVIAMKILTGLVITQVEINQELKELMLDKNNSHDSTINLKREQTNAFDDLLEYFYLIFIKNFHIQENMMVNMRKESIKELQIWMQLHPKMFIDDLQAFNYLTKMIIDVSSDIRLAALESFGTILKSPKIVKFSKFSKQKITDAIGKRFYDVDRRVAIKAVNVFTVMLKWNDSFITTDIIKMMTHLIFDNIFPIARAAGTFLVAFFLHQEYTPEMIIEFLTNIYLKHKNCDKQLLVEGFLYICPAIQNWTLFCKILLDGSPEDRLQVKEAVADIFSESVNQTLTGKSSKMRVLSRTVVDIESSEHHKITRCFPYLNRLLQKYGDYPNILINLLQIFPLVNTNILVGNFCEGYSRLSSTIKVLFDHHADEELLRIIAEALFHFCNIADFSERAHKITDELGTKHTEELNRFSKERNANTCLAAKKVSILYSHTNLNEKFTWEILSESYSDVDKQIAIHLMSCCAWYLIWNLRSLSDLAQKRKHSELPGHIILHNRTCKEFTHMCFDMLEHLSGERLHFEVYECLCDFYKIYSNELKPAIQFNKKFEDVKLRIDDVAMQNVMINFLNNHVLFNEEIPLAKRRKHVVGFVDLVHLDVLSMKVLSHIFKLYHLKFKEYGPIIESSLKCMAEDPDENSILLMIIHTLASCLENLLKKYQIVDIHSEDAKLLQLLVKQFLKFQYFRTPKSHFKKLIYFSIKYAFKVEQQQAFLYFAKYFINLLHDVTDQKKLLEYFKKNIPRGSEKNDAVLFFGNYLKSVTLAGAAKSNTKSLIKDKENQPPKKTEALKRSRPKKTETSSKKKTVATSTPKTSARSFSINVTGSRKKKKQTTSGGNSQNPEDDMTIQGSTSDEEIDRSMLKMKL